MDACRRGPCTWSPVSTRCVRDTSWTSPVADSCATPSHPKTSKSRLPKIRSLDLRIQTPFSPDPRTASKSKVRFSIIPLVTFSLIGWRPRTRSDARPPVTLVSLRRRGSTNGGRVDCGGRRRPCRPVGGRSGRTSGVGGGYYPCSYSSRPRRPSGRTSHRPYYPGSSRPWKPSSSIKGSACGPPISSNEGRRGP